MKSLTLTAVLTWFVCIGVIAAYAAITPPAAPQINPDLCQPFAAPTGPTITVSSVTALQNAVNTAVFGDTILIADGIYNLDGVYLRLAAPNVTLRSASGNRESVVLDGNYITTEII